MTPLQLDILLHYHVRGVEYHKIDSNSTRLDQALLLVADNLLNDNLGKDCNTRFSITTKGEAHLHQILNLTLPEPCFLMSDGTLTGLKGQLMNKVAAVRKDVRGN